MALVSSDTMGSGGAKLLCACRMLTLLPMAMPEPHARYQLQVRLAPHHSNAISSLQLALRFYRETAMHAMQRFS